MLWNFSRFGDSLAVVDEYGQRLTYAQLSEESRALCAAAGGRCLVMQLCQNTMGSLLGYAGFLEGGIAPALLGADINREAFQALYQAYTPKFIWAPVAFKHPGCLPVYKRFGYHLLRTAFSGDLSLHPDLALLLTTSGSTGSPKFVRQSYANIRANTDSIVEYLALTEAERPITTLPMHYTYGLSIINTHLDVGASLLLTDKGIAQKDFWRFFREEAATSFGGVPYTFEMLDQMRFTRMELPSLTTMTQAGGKLLPALHQKLAEWCLQTGRKFIVMYGQCEATARMAYLPWEQSLTKTGAMGVAIPGGRFELVDESGAVITKPYTTGELRYYGDNVTLGYAESASHLSLGDERKGVLDTGDMAQMDEDGTFTIVGRKKRFLKLFGNRVNLDEVERMVKTAFPGADVACGGLDDQLCLYAVQESELPAMRAFLIEKTGLNPAAFRVQAVGQIPKNEAGKTLYKELEQ
ncbi:MAG: AMP-binding protein [Clostridia bacterium]|nr:AMP-binding protein [Clostridia bacterium]